MVVFCQFFSSPISPEFILFTCYFLSQVLKVLTFHETTGLVDSLINHDLISSMMLYSAFLHTRGEQNIDWFHSKSFISPSEKQRWCKWWNSHFEIIAWNDLFRKVGMVVNGRNCILTNYIDKIIRPMQNPPPPPKKNFH